MTVTTTPILVGMGLCYSVSCVSCCSADDEGVRKVALKLPHGSKGVTWVQHKFQPVDINKWLEQIYKKWKPTGWLCYNDDLPEGTHTTRGHCKGILTWNDTRIGWLIHSVPRFPQTFDGSAISPIGQAELIYGQSFLYVEQSRIHLSLEDVLRQIEWMKPNFFHKHNMPPVIPYNSTPLEIKILRWSPTIIHLAKSPDHATDFIGVELQKGNDVEWFEESWKRGSEYAKHQGLTSIETLTIDGTTFNSSQDHSKWAVTQDHVWIGDLNHMKSQEKRGGGGMVITDDDLASAFLAFFSFHHPEKVDPPLTRRAE